MHARWNPKIIDPLVEGTKKALMEAGVKEQNIVVQTVPGSYELPLAVQRYVKRHLPFRCTLSGPTLEQRLSVSHLLSAPSPLT